jgi:hypothetical protein
VALRHRSQARQSAAASRSAISSAARPISSILIPLQTRKKPRFGFERRGMPKGDIHLEEERMPPRGVKKGTKLAREYEHIKDSERQSGKSLGRAKEIAARTVNKERARSGQSRTASKSSTNDISSSRRGGLRSGTARPKGRTVEQLYNEAKKMNIPGRSSMNKAQLQRAVDGKKSGRAASSSRSRSTSSRTSRSKS